MAHATRFVLGLNQQEKNSSIRTSNSVSKRYLLSKQGLSPLTMFKLVNKPGYSYEEYEAIRM